MRQAPDGRTEGGNQPTESSRITRRLVLAPTLPMDKEARQGEKMYNNRWFTLDIGSHINGTREARLKAGAERTLEAVACMPLIMIEASPAASH